MWLLILCMITRFQTCTGSFLFPQHLQSWPVVYTATVLSRHWLQFKYALHSKHICLWNFSLSFYLCLSWGDNRFIHTLPRGYIFVSEYNNLDPTYWFLVRNFKPFYRLSVNMIVFSRPHPFSSWVLHGFISLVALSRFGYWLRLLPSVSPSVHISSSGR